MLIGIEAQADSLVPSAPPPNTKFVAVGWDLNNFFPNIISSEDGTTWVDRSPAPPASGGQLYGVAYNGMRWVAAGKDGDLNAIFYHSDDAAVSWTAVSPSFGVTVDVYTLCWTGTRFIAGGAFHVSGLPFVAVSSDGVTWTTKTPDPNTGGRINRLSGISTLALGVGANTAGSTPRIMSSANDGDTWISRTPAPSSSWNVQGIAIKTGLVAVAVGDGSSTVRVCSSTDGTTWTSRTGAPSTGNGFNDVTWNGTAFVAVGRDLSSGSVPKVMTSPDGTTWTARTAPAIDFFPLSIGAANDGTVVAVGTESGQTDPRMMLSSDNGVTWTQAFPPVTTLLNLQDVAGTN